MLMKMEFYINKFQELKWTLLIEYAALEILRLNQEEVV